MSAGLDNCLYRGIHDNLTAEVGCTLPYLPEFGDGSHVCDPKVRQESKG